MGTCLLQNYGAIGCALFANAALLSPTEGILLPLHDKFFSFDILGSQDQSLRSCNVSEFCSFCSPLEQEDVIHAITGILMLSIIIVHSFMC